MHTLSASSRRLGKKGRSCGLGAQASGIVSTLQYTSLARSATSVHVAAVRATDLPHRMWLRGKQREWVGKQVVGWWVRWGGGWVWGFALCVGSEWFTYVLFVLLVRLLRQTPRLLLWTARHHD